jgi:hypothetical protein
MKLICKMMGHAPAGKVHGVHTNIENTLPDPDRPEHLVGYRMRLCARCGYRCPISPEDAAAKARIIDAVSRVMNGTRAGYGLRPVSWDM